MSMLCLNTYLDDSLSDKVNLNIDWNSLITAHNYLFIIINSLMNFPVTQTTLPVRSPHCYLFCNVETARIIEIFTSLD